MRAHVSLIDPSPPSPDHLPRAAVAAPGEPVWVGRAPAATLCVPGDAALDDRHVLIVCYAGACRVFDASGRGVVVDGAMVSEALLRDGAVLRVGATVARVDLLPDDPAERGHGAEAASLGATDQVPEPAPAHVAGALAVLQRAPAPLYAILDAARLAPGVGAALSAQELMAAIPDDVDALDYADAAPYLVRLAPESPLLARLLAVSWGRAECTFLASTRSFAEVRAFLRDLMDARVDDGTATGRRVLFRYYDPVVLARLLSQPGSDVARLFGPVRAWFVEAPAEVPAPPGPEYADADASEDATPHDGEPAWMEPPTSEVDAPPLPSVLLEFRPRQLVAALAPNGHAPGAAGSTRVTATCRAHDLSAPSDVPT